MLGGEVVEAVAADAGDLDGGGAIEGDKVLGGEDGENAVASRA